MEGIMMNNGLNETNDEIKLDSDKLKRMLQKVYRIERENTKTGSKTEKKRRLKNATEEN